MNYRVFIIYCLFFQKISNISDSGLSLLSLGVSVCTHTGQVKHQRCNRTGRVQKITKLYGKTQYLMNTLYMLNLKIFAKILNKFNNNILISYGTNHHSCPGAWRGPQNYIN